VTSERRADDALARPLARSGCFLIYHDRYSIGAPDRYVDFETHRDALDAIAEAKKNGQTVWGPFDHEPDF
jgi:hypothetical protein